MIDQVKVKNIDDSCHGTGGRVVTVRPCGKESFMTPTRPFSVPEFKAKEFLPFDGTMEGNLGAVQIDVKGERYHHFMKQNGTVIRTRRRATKYSDLTCCFENFMILDVPEVSPDDTTALKLFMDMQLDIFTLNSLSVPPIATNSVDTMTRIVRGWSERAEEYGKGAVPQLKMNEDPGLFRMKLKALSDLAESDEIQLINLIYADPRTHPHQYAALWESRETNALFNCSGVPRRGREVAPGLNISPLLELQRHGVDTITHLTRTASPGFIMRLRDAPPPDDLDGIKSFTWPYHPAGAVLEKRFWRALPPASIECNCRVCNRMSQSEIMETYSYNEDGEIVNLAMPAASKLHDAISSQMEYSVMRRRIESREMAEYMSGMDECRISRLGV